eukprot:360665-Chlamydomonas_euryale.AAC.3
MSQGGCARCPAVQPPLFDGMSQGGCVRRPAVQPPLFDGMSQGGCARCPAVQPPLARSMGGVSHCMRVECAVALSGHTAGDLAEVCAFV